MRIRKHTHSPTPSREPTEQDFGKLRRIINFLVATIDDVIMLESDDSGNLHWCIDASFAIHKQNIRSHDGSVFAMGKGSIIKVSGKQRRK